MLRCRACRRGRWRREVPAPSSTGAVLGALLVVAGLGYATDGIGAVLSQDAWTAISTFTFLGEFLLAIWLVIRARPIAASAAALEAAPDPGR